MSYGNGVPIREELLPFVQAAIEKHKANFTVLHFDIVLQQLLAGGNQVQVANCWASVVVTTGALLGDENHLCYTYTMTDTPKPPSPTVIDAAIRDTFQRLGLMRVRQMQQNQIGKGQS